MRSDVFAMRALGVYVGDLFDRAEGAEDAATLALAEFFVPILKGWATEDAVALTSDGIQVHGGMGFIEETGAAQHYRDARIMPIYEGTTAIQSNDLIGRKVIRDGGATAERLFALIDATIAAIMRMVERSAYSGSIAGSRETGDTSSDVSGASVSRPPCARRMSTANSRPKVRTSQRLAT